jgi:hypothetical protein
MYTCTLPSSLVDCQYRSPDGKCLNTTKGCGFRDIEKKDSIEPYTRKKRWYEEYTQK